MQDLGTLGGTNSYAYGINAGGQMVGAAQINSGDPPCLLVYRRQHAGPE